jgi:hypothetical protein
VDLNSLIPHNSSLQLTVANYISDRGEIVGGGNPLGCTDNDTCNHVYVLVPCDENHPGIEGCDYSLVDPATLAEVHPPQITTATTTTSSQTKLSPVEPMARFRSAQARSNHRFATRPTSPQ